MRCKSKGPQNKKDRVLFIRISKHTEECLEMLRSLRSDLTGIELSKSDVARALIAEECKRLDIR